MAEYSIFEPFRKVWDGFVGLFRKDKKSSAEALKYIRENPEPPKGGAQVRTTKVGDAGTAITIGEDHPAVKYYRENKEAMDKAIDHMVSQPEAYPEMAELMKTSDEAFGTGPELPGMPPEQQFPEFNFDPYEQRARRDFQQKTLPGIAERFTSLTGGGQRSGAFERQRSQAGVDLDERLAALRSTMEPQYALQKAMYGLNRGKLEQGLGTLGLQKEALRRGGLQTVMQRLSEARKPAWEQKESMFRLLGYMPQPYQAFQPAGPTFMNQLASGLGQGIGYGGTAALGSLF